MNNFFLSFCICLLLCSYSLQAYLSGIPGEVIAIKQNTNEDLNSYLTVEKNGHFYALVPMPFDKQGKSIKFQIKISLLLKRISVNLGLLLKIQLWLISAKKILREHLKNHD